MKSLTIGIVGAGYMGREHARCLRLIRPFFGNEALKLIGIADQNKAAAQMAAREFEFNYGTDSVDALIDDPNINTIFTCIPTKFHHKVIQKCVACGKNIFVEKPFAKSIVIAKEIHDLLIESGTKHQVGFVLRYAPVYHALKKILVERAKESSLRTVILRDDQAFPVGGVAHFTGWRADVEMAGAGVLIEHGLHDVDIIEWMFGPVKRVSARMDNFAKHPGIEDYMEIRFEFAKGVTANLIELWHDIAAHQAVRHFEIFFQKALITLDTYDMHHVNIRDKNAEHMLERSDLYRMVADDPLYKDISRREDLVFMSDFYALQDYWFVRNLLEDKPLSPTITEGLRAFIVADACYRSAAEDGAWITV